MKELLEKYKNIIPYLFFGVCTTVVNMAVYWLCTHICALSVMQGTIVAWVTAVLFAYLTNRKWVFPSEATGRCEIFREIAAFFGCRLATGVLDWLIMFVFADMLHFDDMIVKALANVIVIILNYVASKLLVFRRHER